MLVRGYRKVFQCPFYSCDTLLCPFGSPLLDMCLPIPSLHNQTIEILFELYEESHKKPETAAFQSPLPSPSPPSFGESPFTAEFPSFPFEEARRIDPVREGGGRVYPSHFSKEGSVSLWKCQIHSSNNLPFILVNFAEI